MNDIQISQQADEALADFNFGEGVTVVATSGWQYDGQEVSCSVFLQFDEDEPDADSHRGTFSVNIVDGKVVEASCSCEGQPIGVAV